MSKDHIKAGVIGHPITHSKSPLIHGYWISKQGLLGSYDAIDISPAQLETGVRKLITQGYRGFNVTLPHKQEMLKLCDDVDETARSIGAVNMVSIYNGKLKGFNTDAFGYIENLKAHNASIDKNKPAIVLGAGGAARAIVYGLLQEGFQNIIVTNRTLEKAIEIAAMDGKNVKACPWDEREMALSDAGLLVNTTALGMTGKEKLLIGLTRLPQEAVVSDIVYAPLMTDLLLQAKERGNTVVTGIGMLLHQARPAFATWFGVMPDVDEALQQKVLG